MSNIVSLKERIEYYRKRSSSNKKPVSREEFDALLEELEIYAEEIYKTQQIVNKMTRILTSLSSPKDAD